MIEGMRRGMKNPSLSLAGKLDLRELAFALSKAAFAVTHDGQNVKVLSDVCTHLQCRVSWHEDRQMFISPCHNGLFSIDGEVLGGPPPRPLDQFQTKIENGQIQILLAA